MDVGLVVGVVAIGIVHGVLPDHGWPIAATYALGRRRTWIAGVVAGSILGIGHLVSSVALVGAYYWVSGFATFVEGPWLRYVAGTMLVALGVHEYRNGGHDHDDSDHGHHDDNHDHDDSDHGHHDDNHDHDDDPGGHGHVHLSEADADRGLFALGTTALLLGFAHEEPIQILAICVGTARCLELMFVYSLAVIVAILVPTLVLIAGYEQHRETVERYTPYLPTVTAIVLVTVGLAFLLGVV